jgi:adenylosuccinate synthase
VARFSGGANAGPPVKNPSRQVRPAPASSGVLREGVLGIIGSGCVVDPGALLVGDGKSGEGRGVPGRQAHRERQGHLVHPAAKVTEPCRKAAVKEGSAPQAGG